MLKRRKCASTACQHFFLLGGKGGCRRHGTNFDAVEFVTEAHIYKTHSVIQHTLTHALSLWKSVHRYTVAGDMIPAQKIPRVKSDRRNDWLSLAYAFVSDNY